MKMNIQFSIIRQVPGDKQKAFGVCAAGLKMDYILLVWHYQDGFRRDNRNRDLVLGRRVVDDQDKIEPPTLLRAMNLKAVEFKAHTGHEDKLGKFPRMQKPADRVDLLPRFCYLQDEEATIQTHAGRACRITG